MNEIQVFNNPDFGDVRTITIDGEPWFVGKDIAKALGYSDTAKAIRVHVDEEDKHRLKADEIATLNKASECIASTLKRTNADETSTLNKTKADKMATLKISNFGVNIINESGLYCLIFNSKLPKAKQFKRWVTSEVLPAIRKTGCYAINCKERKADITDISLKFKEYNGDYEQRKAWFTYMLTALSVKTMTPSKSLLHQAYQMMIQQGTDLNAEALIHFNETGAKVSTFEVIISDAALSEQLADILVYNMKSSFIGIE